MTTIRLAVPAPLSLALQVWVWVGGVRHTINGPAQLFTVVLPLPLRVLRVATGFFRFRLRFAPSESSLAWRNWQVEPLFDASSLLL